MNRFTFIFALCFVISEITFSQARFFEGFIIDNNKDTVRGLIEYKGNQTNSNVCVFKKNEESAPVSYSPNEIKGYRYAENKFYVSKSITLNGQQQNLFLEYLVDGVVDVYCYYENNNPHYLIQNEKDSLIELKTVKKVMDAETAKKMQNRSTFDQNASASYVYESKTYVYILKDIFKASPKVTQKADQAVLNHGSLIKLASSYHKEMCPDQECKIYRKGSDGHFKAGVMLGIGYLSLSNMSTDNVRENYLIHCDYVSDVYPSLGFFILSGLPGLNANMYLQFDGSVNKLKIETSGNAIQYNYLFIHQVKFSQTTFNASAVIKYAFGAKTFKPVIQFGGFVNYGFGESFERNTEYDEGHIYTKDSPFSAMDFGIAAGTGFLMETSKKKTIVVDLRYRMGFKFIDIGKANYFSLGIGYQL